MELFVTTGEALVRLREGDPPRELLSGSGAQAVAARDGLVVVGCRGSGVLVSADGGETFEDGGLPEGDAFSVAVSPLDGAVYAGTEPSRLFRSGDQGRSWEELVALQDVPSRPEWSFPPRPWTSHVRWISPSPADPDLLLVGIELGGVLRTTDGGRSFSDHRPGAQRDVHCLAWHARAPGRAYEAGGGGAAWSRDGGETWEAADAGRDRHYTWGLAVDPADPERWWLSAAPGPWQAHGSGPAESVVYRWEGGGPWEPVLGPLDAHAYALATVDGELVAGLADGTLLASADGGGRWRELARGIGRVSAIAAAAH